jgi:hypothetical protein
MAPSDATITETGQELSRTMSTTYPTPPKFPPQRVSMEQVCKHPRVRVVAREEDAEFVECQECGEVFDSSEFKDMAIEEKSSAAEL